MVEVEFFQLGKRVTAEHVVSHERVLQFLGQVFAAIEHLHDQLEHLVVVVASEEGLSCH